ncbi:MAG: PAS domain S-box protein [Verrucomicrobia subdivision 3 bacterium]|nr:PAS domain S-box protein [Limisphaerales bacterium]
MFRSSHIKSSRFHHALLRLVFGGALLVTQSEGAAEVVQTAAQVRDLTVEQAQRHDPVKLRGVVTFFDETLFSRFIHDGSAGIYLRESTNTPGLLPGQLVEVEGSTSPGEYAPIVVPKRVRILGEAPLPSAKPVTFDQLTSGKEDSQFVEVVGIIRSVQFEAASQHHLIELATGGGRLPVYARRLPVSKFEELVGSTARVRGVCSTVFNRQRQLFAIRLMVPRPEDLTIESSAARDPFDIPIREIGSLLQFTPQGSYGQRVKVTGTLIYQHPGTVLYLQDEKQGLYVQTKEKGPLTAGDRIEVLGFPAQGDYTPVLQDAIYRRIEPGVAPRPDPVNHDEALKGTHDCRLVRIEAKLLDRARASGEQFLVLSENDFIFHAYLEQRAGVDAFAHLENGSQVAVTGVCLIEPGTWQAGENWRAKSFRLLLRSPGDVELLRAPSWWTFSKVLGIAGALGVVSLAAFVWVVVLRRRVQQQTEIIRVRLQMEAALKERYEALFENANDMVFTHDLSGKITSINHTGERLLQRRRQSILAQSLIDLMAEEHRSAATQWLAQVVNGVEMPTVEWDFLNANGHRIKLEISSRLIEQAGHVVEFEGIARDITERRRLEREILEISNREQRRIGHDLHDGVCQQLAAITYLVDILGDQLQEKSAPEYAEAERIGNLLNEANAQARNVARGLFPVRLEEHGLVLALEELAASASSRYRITCRFVCEATPVKVDSEVELHLYYIVQEALLNAVNHGKATGVIVTLTAEGDRMKLTVQDNGAGFELSNKSRTGMGIRIMRHRAKVIGATLELQSQVGQGTQITCVFSPAARESARNNK